MPRLLIVSACLAAAASPAAWAQQATPTRPADKPPIAQGWIDIATFASPGMPGGMAGMMMGGMGGAGGDTPMSAMFGGKKQGNQFGLTRAGGSGSYVDVTLRTSRNPSLAEALQSRAAGQQARADTATEGAAAGQAGARDAATTRSRSRRSSRRARSSCTGVAARPSGLGSPRSSTSDEHDQGTRRYLQRSTRYATRHSLCAGPTGVAESTDNRLVPAGASLAGAHAFTGQGVPESFKFTLPPAQDIMPPIALQQAQVDGVTQLSWQVLPTARGYFIAAMGGKGDGDSAEMTLWTSSELPDSGFGLVDYQTNKSVDQWLKEKVLLAPATTRCDVPKGIFGEGDEASGAMLRMIAYGTELNLALPPRPTDPKIAWEPDWALKVRVKSVASAMLGMPAMDSGGTMEDGSAAGGEGSSSDGAPPTEEPKKKKKFGLMDALDAVKDSVPR